ncbi:MAG: ABC transporter substrate-binding protein, partial [Planctomycetes bacterium]|nr:ABC transporter substrate-binding protein [Planctomycetota bacterium]
AGWAKLLRILANAKRFTDSAGAAADAPVVGEAIVATCIDFYGAIRVAQAPGRIVYVSPPGETTFSPDPIAILKNPPNPELARRFVAFVLSEAGQAMLALPVGDEPAPLRSALARLPIRKDVYEKYAGRMLSSIVNPYRRGQSMELQGFRKRIDYGVLRLLVRAAAIDNAAFLRAAGAKLIESDYDDALTAQFDQLPENIRTLDAMARTKVDLKDETKREKILTEWQRFFRAKFKLIAGDSND